ncbi:hypothetical protein FP2506_10156 [Fulvimarina pelagi HTCC2506]|uniref:Uncharacterized protein n=1 Tax=Fulvimarina pelagi HTCC2506 TaxID=314231 RepID=Q0G565_9HYPH|nr:hypothetical protein FP2506_10156 [Fulvimarina pelagi HTCC2506]
MLGARPIDAHAAHRVFGGEIVLWRGFELLAAALATEVEDPAVMFARWLSGFRVDRHAADGITNGGYFLAVSGLRMIVMLVLVCVFNALVHASPRS